MADQNPYLSLVPDAPPPASPADAAAQVPAGPTAEPNPYLQVIDSGTKSTPYRVSVMQTADQNPDAEARVQALGRKYGVPAETVRLQQKDYERRDVIDSIDYEKLAFQSPATSGLLATPQTAAISRDDTENLSGIERTLRYLSGGAKSVVAGVGPSFTSGLYGGVQSFFDTLAQGADQARQRPISFSEGPVGLAAQLLPENPFARVAAGVAQWRREQDVMSKSLIPQASGNIEAGVYSGLQSVGQLGSALATGGAAGLLPLLTATTAGQAYGEARDKGVPVQQAIPFGVSQGAIEYATEKLPVATFLRNLNARTPLLSFVTQQLKAEVPNELVATTLQNLNEWAVLNPEKPVGDYIREQPDALAQTLVATIVAGGALTGAARGVQAVGDRMTRKQQDAAQAQANAAALTEQDQLAAVNKLRPRDADTFGAFVREATADGPVQDVYIDVQSLAQSGVDVAALAQVSPSVAAQLPEATATGGTIRIPLDEFTTNVAGTDLSAPLVPYLKTDPLGMNQKEAEEFMQSGANQFQQEVERTLAAQAPDQAFKASRDAVQQDIAQRLDAVNRFTPQVNQQYATMLSNFYAVQGARTGMTPEEFAQRYPIRFAREDLVDGEQRLDEHAGQQQNPQHAASLLTTDQARQQVLTDTEWLGSGSTSAALGGRWAANSNFIKTIRSGDQEVGEVYGEEVPNAVVISESHVNPDQQGKGAARQAYEQLANYAIAQGKILHSDSAVSESASRVYDALARRGYTVEKNPAAVLENGRWQSPDNAPVYTVTAAPQQVNQPQKIDEDTGLPLNADGTVTVYHHTSAGKAAQIRQTGRLKSAGEPDVYVTTRAETDTGYGDTAVAINIDPSLLQIDDEFPDGRTDYRIDTGKPGGSIKVKFPQVNQGERGSLTVPRDITQQAPILTLLENADLSTFLHESGHFYLEVLSDLAARPDAPQEIKDDMDAVLKWFGVPDIETWRGMTLDQKRDNHEQFARGFEAYLFEGKAPSQELRGVFQRFRAWLVNVYRNLARLNVQLTDEVRSVFDRMLATSDAIAEQQVIEGAAPMFDSAQAAGMDENQWRAYQNLNSEAQQDALQNLETRSMRDMKWLNNARSRVLKDLQKQADAQRAAVRDEVEAEVYATPLYSAMQFLRRGTTTINGEPFTADAHKLDIDALGDMYGGEGDKFALLDWSKLGYGRYGMLGKDGISPDAAAQMFGYTSGDQLVRALLDAEPVDSVIEGMTDQRMLERYGDLTDKQSMDRAADAAIHNDARARFIATELNALNQAIGDRRVLASAARQFAEQMIARLRVRDVKPGQYTAAEGRAARESERAFKKGDLETAAAEKRNQLVNTYAAKAAYAAQDEIQKSVDYLKKFDKESTRKSIDPSYREQIDALLERFDLRTGQSLTAIDRRKSLLEWVQSQEEQGLEPIIDPALLDEARRQSYKDMTVEELRGLTDAVRNIEHLGRLKKKLLTAKDQREFQAAVDELVASIENNAKRVVPEERSSDRGRLVNIRRMFRGFKAEHRKFASYAREFDGWQDAGAAWEYLVRTMNSAGDFEAVENERATKKLGELLRPILKQKGLHRKQFFPEIGKSFTKEERLGIALNMGNAVNRERVLAGENLTPSQLDTLLDTLTEEDWKFVQGVWDYLDSFRPQIAAKEKRLTGVEPEWVEAEPVQTKFGEFKGGYYPISYDALRSSRAESDINAEVQKQIERGLYTRAQTRRGHLKSRTESTGRPIRYDLGVITDHVQQVIHDLAWHEYLVDANRLLRNSGVDEAVRRHYGPEILKQMKDTLKDVAVGESAADGWMGRMLNHLRIGSTVAGLGYRLTTSLMQPLGLTQSAVRIGPKWVLKGASHWAAGAVGLEKGMKDMYEMSDFMRLRANTLNREINEIQNRVSGKSELRQKIDASYFYMIQKAQLIADVPTWWGAYEKAMSKEDMTEDKAIALADQAVRDAQGAGQIGDLAAIQRGGPLKKLWTNFYSFFSTTYNLTAEAVGRTNFRKPREVALLAADLALLYTLPALLGTVVKSALHGGPDDDDEFLRSLIADQLNYLFGTVVGLREVSAAVQGATGLYSDYSGPGGARFFAEFAKLGKQAAQGEVDEAFLKALNSSAGIVFHYPAGQINATVSGLQALADGKTENPGALLVGPPPNK